MIIFGFHPPREEILVCAFRSGLRPAECACTPSFDPVIIVRYNSIKSDSPNRRRSVLLQAAPAAGWAFLIVRPLFSCQFFGVRSAFIVPNYGQCLLPLAKYRSTIALTPLSVKPVFSPMSDHVRASKNRSRSTKRRRDCSTVSR